jgi:hypothetical protein
LLTVVGVGIRAADGHVARLEGGGQGGEDAHLEVPACDPPDAPALAGGHQHRSLPLLGGEGEVLADSGTDWDARYRQTDAFLGLTG